MSKITDLTQAINNLSHTIQNASSDKYQALVHCHEYGVSTYLFPAYTKLTVENALAFIKSRYADFRDEDENFYICEIDKISCLPQ